MCLHLRAASKYIPCYLFVEEPLVRGGSKMLRPVSWENPEDKITPFTIAGDKQEWEWVREYGEHHYNPIGNPTANMKMLCNAVGYWPPPINIWGEYLSQVEFNDTLPEF